MFRIADAGDSFREFFEAFEQFFENLAAIQWGSLALAMLVFVGYLTLRSRASFHILRAAYPDERIEWRKIWGAYFAGYGFNSVIPARGGDVVRLFLTKNAVPNSSYPAVAATFAVELVFLTLLAVGSLVAIALLSLRVKAFWARVRQGLTIVYDRERFVREVLAVQLAGWTLRFTAFWFLLEAFNVGGSVKNVLLVLGVNAVAAAVPFTPGGAGVQQALLVKVFGDSAAGASTVAAYSVGQQLAIAAFTFAVGFAALFFIFRVRSFKEVLAR